MAGSGDAMNPPLSKQKESSGGTKNRLKVTGKRLPWLNNKASAATPNKTMMQRASVDGPAPAPQGNPYSPSLGTQAVRPPSSPFQHRRSMASPTKRRVPSSGASPSPTPRKLSQASRKPSFRPISPLTEEGSVIRSTASTNGPNDTISDPPMTRPVQEFVQEAPPRKGSLAPVPGHLEEPSPSPTRDRRSSRRVSIISGGHGVSVTSLSEPALTFGEPVPRRASLAPVPAHLEEPSSSPESSDSNLNVLLPEVFRSAEVHPQQPVPKRHSFESGRDRQLSNAIEGLEGLVQEAVDIADENANPDQVREVFGIIEDAALAVREASAIPAQDLMATTSPLKVSSPEDAPVENQRGSEAIDWAYKGSQNSGQQPPSLSSSSSDDSVWRRRSKIDYRSDQETLLPPKSIHSTGREHTDYVQRPGRNRSHSRGRSRLRRAGGSDADARRDRRHRSFRRYLDADSIDGKSRYPNNNTVPYEEEEEMDPPRPHKEKQRKYELSVRDQAHHHTFSLLRHHRRQPIARNWGTAKKRLTAAIACFNTALIGIIAGIYAGEVPRIQYVLADESHIVIVGNVVLYAGLAISTFISWPLPLLHGRKPYILASLALALPLQFPQAIVTSATRSPNRAIFRTGLLVARAFSGLVLGFANVNFVTILLDLFGASLQSKNPHQELVVVNDIRRHGGGMGMWLGIWSGCAIGSIAVGFQIGAAIIEILTPDWGFYIVIIILAAALVLNILAPETRRSAYRRSVTEVYDRDENFITRRVARGEIKLHLGPEGPLYWFEEIWAGMKLSVMMCLQPGFFILALYLAWMYAQVVLVIVLLGALLSRSYKWYPRYVGLGVMSIAFGALLAIPLTKAGIFSRERKNPFRTDSMTFQSQVTWSSHLIRRIIFMLALPLMGIAYSISAAGRPKPFIVPIIFAGAVGFLSVLAIAECHGLIMETFDTCDLQPGVNTRHRLQSMAAQDRRRRTNYTSFPRVSAGIFASQTLAFIGAAVATGVGGIMTRRIGAQASTGVTAGILLGLTILLTAVLWRFWEIQVIPNHAFGTRRDTRAWKEFKEMAKDDWKPVIIGNPSGKMRKMSVLELGGLSRWTEIRKLNYLIRDGNDAPSWRTPPQR